jgi:hypothetical protein
MGGSIGKIVNMGGDALGGGDLAKGSLKGSQTAAAGQQQAIDYLQKQNELPVELQQSALKGLGGLYGLEGGDAGYGQKLTDISTQSPIYKAMAGQIDQSLADNQDQTGASASQRGLLGSGVLADALAKYRARAGVDKSNALSQVYQQNLGGITNLTQTPAQSGNIAQLMAGKGLTLGQGQTAAAQAKFDANQAFVKDATSGAAAFSDIRLKSSVKFIGKIAGHKWYSWKWNEIAAGLGLSGNGEGVMAHEVEKYAPHAIGENSGFMTVNYNVL